MSKKPEQTLWQRAKNDEQGWLVAGPLFAILGGGWLYLVYRMIF